MMFLFFLVVYFSVLGYGVGLDLRSLEECNIDRLVSNVPMLPQVKSMQ